MYCGACGRHSEDCGGYLCACASHVRLRANEREGEDDGLEG